MLNEKSSFLSSTTSFEFVLDEKVPYAIPVVKNAIYRYDILKNGRFRESDGNTSLKS